MPELPEVEIVRRGLLPLVTGKVIRSITIEDQKIVLPLGLLVGRTITGIDRKGKFLFFRLCGQDTLLVHLGMTGVLVYEEPGCELPYRRLFIKLDAGALLYSDQRRFGKVRYLDDPSRERLWDSLGMDPLSGEYDFQRFQQLLAARSCRVKDFLLDQRFLCGIGNIYACEILFRTGIHPEKRVSRLSIEEVGWLFRVIPQVLEEALSLQGTTIRDFRRSDGRKGEFQNRLCVYGRAEQSCPQCGTAIKRIRFAGRSSFYCPSCQA
ncbi:MAG TPA: bifunctional DNA-formamidopyrimidine glycosylase/DNA-(apurinic or apyrimidinic site) lyase [Atribacteraceae bacterium]|nr:bifunctional DNA-formamidopyrimidine glycosylase/DNA-(apurinic or apyrimidinic site) lyase [Atribacteraceae bacterium]